VKKWVWPWAFLLLAPIALAVEHAHALDGAWVFLLCALAVVPLAALLGDATEQLAERAGAGLGGLLNATFGNAAELIIGIVALKAGKTEIVMASLTGSVIGNSLFVLGGAILAGGYNRDRQTFNAQAAQSGTAALHLAVFSMVMPAVLHSVAKTEAVALARDVRVSLGIAGIMIVTYLLSLYFSLKTHRHLFDEDVEKVPDVAPGVVEAQTKEMKAGPRWPVAVSLGVLLLASVLIAFVSEALVASVEPAVRRFGFGETFVGAIVFATIGNAAEHTTAVMMAVRDRMNLAIHIAVESSTQIALFVTPLLVFAGPFLVPSGARPMTLRFELPEVAAMWAAAQIVSAVINDGETNWLEGVKLLALYGIIGVSFYVLG
jgi:Ca2+:H+ antiporter